MTDETNRRDAEDAEKKAAQTTLELERARYNTIHHAPDRLGRHTCQQQWGTFTTDPMNATCIACLRILAQKATVTDAIC
jgi:hypothetical protein